MKKLLGREPPTREEIAGAVARGWCTPNTGHLEMNADLAWAITDEIVQLLAAAPQSGEPAAPADTELFDDWLKRIGGIQGEHFTALIDCHPSTLVRGLAKRLCESAAALAERDAEIASQRETGRAFRDMYYTELYAKQRAEAEVAELRKDAELCRDATIEECAKVCDASVKWTPPLTPPHQTTTDETAYQLGKAIRALRDCRGRAEG